MDYNHIKQYLDKFRFFVEKKENTNLLISDVLFLVIKKRIDIKNISIIKNILNLNVSPLIKSEILMKKDFILNEIKNKNKDLVILDVK